MKIIYFNCNMGAAGDMISAALYELLEKKEEFIQKINAIGLPNIKIIPHNDIKCGIKGTHMEVKIEHDHHEEHDHHHNTYQNILSQIEELNISKEAKQHAFNIYTILGEAEAQVHNQDIEHIHFHEVGTLDAIADVVQTVVLMEMLGYPKIYASYINVGSGTVKCAHGILPVPAPATAVILKDIPVYSNEIKSELCTPTGAAILKYFVSEFGPMPVMNLLKTGYGTGTKDFEVANVVTAHLGKIIKNTDVLEISCNLDDMTSEEIGFAVDVIQKAGALEVFTTPIYMKKNRPAYILTCICKQTDEEKIANLFFEHTSTIGIRINNYRRRTLTSTYEKITTKYGEVSIKKSTGYNIQKIKPEYDDVAQLASKNNTSFKTISEEAIKIYNQKKNC